MNTPARIRLALLGGLAASLAPSLPAQAAVDTAPPVVTVTVREPDRNGWHTVPSVPVTITTRDAGSGVDELSSSVRLSGATTATLPLATGPNEVVVTANGATVLAYDVYDIEGNRRSGTVTVSIDNVKPLVGMIGLVDDQAVRQGTSVPVSAQCDDATSGIGQCLVTTAVSTATPGTYVATATGIDNAGNRADRDVRYRVVGQSDGPQTSFLPERPANAAGWYDAPVDVRIEAHSPYGGTVSSVEVAGRGATAGHTTSVTLAGEGPVELAARGIDALGIAGFYSSMLVRIDTVDPTVELDEIRTVEVGQTYQPWFSCADATSGVATCAAVAGVDAQGLVDTSTPGLRTVTVEGVDRAGNRTLSSRAVEVVDPDADPIAATTRLTAPAVATSGRQVEVQVVVESAAGEVPGGLIEITDSGRSLGTWSRAVGHARTTATLRLDLAPGRHVLVARHSARGVLPSVSAPVTVLVKSPTTGTARYTVKRNGKATATVRITGRDARPSGVVKVYDGAKVVGTARLRADGTAVVRLGRLARGRHVLTTRYLGTDSTYPVSTPRKKVRVR